MKKIDIERKSTKTQITQAEYTQLLGLKLLTEKYNKILDEIFEAAQEITGEIDLNDDPELCGYTCDYLSDFRDMRDLLKRLGLKKVK